MFNIITAKACKLGQLDKEDSKVSEAIHSLYDSYDCEDLIQWNEIVIRIDRRGDLSCIYDDIIYLIEDINSNIDQFNQSFLSSSFTVKLEIKNTTEHLIIKPFFYVVQSFKNEKYFDLKNLDINDLVLIVEAEHFVQQWKKILSSVREDLLRVDYSSRNLEDFHVLDKILS